MISQQGDILVAISVVTDLHTIKHKHADTGRDAGKDTGQHFEEQLSNSRRTNTFYLSQRGRQNEGSFI